MATTDNKAIDEQMHLEIFFNYPINMMSFE